MADGPSLSNYVISVILALLVTLSGFKAWISIENEINGYKKKGKTYSLFIQVMGTRELSSHIFSYCSYSFVEIAMISRCNKLCNSLVTAGTFFSPFLSIKRLVSVNHLLWISKRAKSIFRIDFSIIPITDEVSLDVAKSCCNSHLRYVSIAQNKIITDAGLLDLLTHCNRIEELIIPGTNITDQALSSCRKYLNNLRHVDVSNCENICDEGVVDLFSECKNLEYIDLSSTRISDTSIGALMHSCQRIKEITLFKCFLLTDETCAFISKAPTAATNIASLSVSKCFGLSDAGLVEVAKSLKSLTYLDVSHVETVTDLTLFAIAESMKYISVINTSWCKLVSDAGINTLAAKCANLKELHIRECYRVSEEAIANIKTTNRCNIAVFDY